MNTYRYKNITKKNIIILLDGKKIIVKPNKFIDGPDTLGSYSGLLKINKVLKEQNIVEPEKEGINFVSEIEEYDFINEYVQEPLVIPNGLVYEMIKENKVENFMNKIDLKDVTFIIPICIESEDRKQNLITVLDYFYKYFATNVIICESDKEMKVKNFWQPKWSSFCRLLFSENTTPYFYKTRILNIMTKMTKTDIVVSYDSDVILHPSKYNEAAEKLRSGKLDFCYPFNKPLKHIDGESLLLFRETLDLTSIDEMTKITNPGVPPGGCFFMNKEKFIEAGMENERMISWGPEDQERLSRIKKLNYNVGNIDGYLYHMDHPQTQNSLSTNPLFKLNEKEFEKVNNLGVRELKEYIRSWGK